jgi:hypothetical protein
VQGMGGGAVEITATGGAGDPNRVRIGSILATNINQDNNGSALLSATTGNIVSVGQAPFFTGSNNSAPTVNASGGGVYEIPVALSWTPSIAGSTTAGTPAGSFSGWYQQTGAVMTAQFSIALSSFGGTPAGNTLITNLPNASSASAVLPGSCTISLQSGITFTSTYTSLAGSIVTSATSAELYQLGAGATPQFLALPVTDVGGTALLQGQCIYQAAVF